MNIVAFDLDGTLGEFSQLGQIFDILENNINRSLKKSEFFSLLNIFHKYVRPDMFQILSFLEKMKKEKKCKKVVIYTNNQAPRTWAELIASYLNHMIKSKVFTKVIATYMLHGEIVEECRTTQDKTKNDLLNCLKLGSETKICFIDDQEHVRMMENNVYYIKVNPYRYNYTYEEIIFKLKNSNFFRKLKLSENQVKKLEIEILSIQDKNLNYLMNDREKLNKIEIKNSKILLGHLKKFFSKKSLTPITKKKKFSKKKGKNRTKKNKI
tara:strand:- start:1544 stop:2344 length:801 start_codon:yes stop_codon:yes gene_type:complete